MTLVLLTGATRGIGRAASIALGRQGVELALVGRDPERVRAVAGEAQAAGASAVHEHVADLALMADVRALADEVRESYEHIDVLANNAGAMFASRGETAEGLENTLALNHLSPFLLTHLLRDRLGPTRVPAYTEPRSSATSSSPASSPGVPLSCTRTAFTPG
jgi:NAD(P)-dependent dehydrogenase (short-subunit alcohol dehydrogenase family)